MRTRSLVYFIKPVGIDGPIKIGCSHVPERRLLELSAWSPWPLELIGAIKGTSRDEANFHSRFKDCHSHREWFHSTPLLQATIAAVLNAGNFSPILHLPVNGSIRSISRKPRTEDVQRRVTCAMRVGKIENRLRRQEGDGGVWRAPAGIQRTLENWRTGKMPSTEEMARIEKYFAHPEIHSVRWKHYRPPSPASIEFPP